MHLFKRIYVTVVSLLLVAGCSSSPTSNEDNNNNNEPTEYSLSVSANPSEGGSVDPSSGTYEEGTEVSVEASANEGWAFTEWTGDQESTDNPITVTMDSDMELTANFEDQRSKYKMEVLAIEAEDTLGLQLGQLEDASQGYDDNMDQEAPPPPPEGALNAYFEVNDLDLLKDFRSYTSKQEEWTLQYQVESGQDLQLEWQLLDDTKTPGSLTLTDESGSFEVNMFEESSYTVSGTTSGTLLIKYSYD